MKPFRANRSVLSVLCAWNGSKYQFVTDFLGGCAIGYLEEPGRYSIPDTDEYVMKAYPYHTSERYPDSEPYRRYQQEYNTRRVPAVISRLGGGF